MSAGTPAPPAPPSSRRRRAHLPAFVPQRHRQQVRQGRLVVDNEHPEARRRRAAAARDQSSRTCYPASRARLVPTMGRSWHPLWNRGRPAAVQVRPMDTDARRHDGRHHRRPPPARRCWARSRPTTPAEFWAAHRDRYEARVSRRCGRSPPRWRPSTDRSGLPAAGQPPFPRMPRLPPDTGGVARSAGGCPLGVVLSATALTASAGYWIFDAGQLRRYRAAVDAAPARSGGDPRGHARLRDRRDPPAPRRPASLSGRPPADRAAAPPRAAGHEGLGGGRLAPTDEPLHRCGDAWRAAGRSSEAQHPCRGGGRAPAPAQRARQ